MGPRALCAFPFLQMQRPLCPSTRNMAAHSSLSIAQPTVAIITVVAFIVALIVALAAAPTNPGAAALHLPHARRRDGRTKGRAETPTAPLATLGHKLFLPGTYWVPRQADCRRATATRAWLSNSRFAGTPALQPCSTMNGRDLAHASPETGCLKAPKIQGLGF